MKTAHSVLTVILACAPLLVGASGCGAATEQGSSTDTGNPGIVDAERISVIVGDGELVVAGSAGAVPRASDVTVSNTTTGSEVEVRADGDGAFVARVEGNPGDAVVVEATASDGRTEREELATDVGVPGVECPAECTIPCDFCDAECRFIAGTFFCCDGDVCGAVSCAPECQIAEFDAVELTNASTSLGQCDGECQFALEWSGRANVTLTTSSTRFRPLRFNEGSMTQAGRDALAAAVETVTPATFGGGEMAVAPPCAEGGACPEPTLEIVLRFRVDDGVAGTSYTEPGDDLAPVAGVVDRVRTALSDCQNDEFVEVSAECAPHDADGPAQRLAEAEAAMSPEAVCGEELHVVAVDGAQPGAYNREEVEAQPASVLVRVERPGSHVIALSAYAARDWTVYAEPGAIVERIIVNGYYPQTVVAPEGALVEVHETRDGNDDLEAYVHDWPVAYGESPDAVVLAAKLEALSGRPITTYSSCSDASSFTVLADGMVSGYCSGVESVASYSAIPACTE